MNRRDFIGSSAGFLLFLRSNAFGNVFDGAPALRVGETFRFRTTSVKKGNAAASFEETRGQAFIPPLPTEQTVRVIGEQQCSNGLCLVVEATRTLPSFVPGTTAQSYSEKIVAQIDKTTGNVYNVKTTMTIDGSVSNSTQRELGPEATLFDFYGPWMLGLGDGYSKTSESNNFTTTVKVIRQETVLGHRCFVASNTKSLSSGQKVESVVWVDAGRRIALKVARGGSNMQIVRA